MNNALSSFDYLRLTPRADVRTEYFRIIASHDENRGSHYFRESMTALHLAARYGHVEEARILVDLGVEIDPRDRDNCSPLLMAAMFENWEVFDYLARLPYKDMSIFSDYNYDTGETVIDLIENDPERKSLFNRLHF